MIQEKAETTEPKTFMQATEQISTAELAQRGQNTMPTALEAHIDKNGSERVPLFPENELGDFRRRWQGVQASFVDDPRVAVRRADEMVASLMTRLAQVFADERSKLEQEWDKGENVSTEDLRVALQRYRSFFDRLLCV
jgi:hypothetical protein